MALVIAFNSTITTTGTTQQLDPNGPETLPYAQTLTIAALSTNTAILYVSNMPGSGAGVGYPIAAGGAITILDQTTGLYITGTSGDKYGVIGS